MKYLISLADKVFARSDASGGPWTIKARFSGSLKVIEYAVTEPLLDGFVGQRLGSAEAPTIVRYGALDYIRILEEGEQ